MATIPNDPPAPDPLDLETGKRTTKENDVDYMADAPKARPYSEAITDEHRRVLKDEGVVVEE